MARTLTLTTVRVRRARPGKLPQSLGERDGQRIANLARENDVAEVMVHGRPVQLLDVTDPTKPKTLWSARDWDGVRSTEVLVTEAINVMGYADLSAPEAAAA